MQCQETVVDMFNMRAHLVYSLDEIEVARRRAVGLGAIADRAVLDALMSLPIGMPVPVASLSDRDARLVRRAPRGAVEVRAGVVTRRAVSPVVPHLATVPAKAWRLGLVKAGRFAPFCSRSMRLERRPRDAEDAFMQASFWGVGIVLPEGEMVTPEPHVRHRHTAAYWWFSEQLYRQVADALAG